MNKYKTGHKLSFVSMVFSIFLNSALYGTLTYFIGTMVDLGLEKNLSEMFSLSKLLVVIALLSLVVGFVTSFIENGWINLSMNQLKKDYIDQVLDQDILEVQKEKIPRYFSNLTNDFDRYETKYIKSIPQIIGMGAQFSIALVLLSVVNPALVIVPIVMLVMMWNRSKKSSEPIKEKEQEKTESLESYTQYINETILGYEVIKQHQIEESREQQFMDHATQVQKDNYQVDVETTKVEAINSLMINTLLVVLVIVGMVVAVNTGVTFGNIVIVFSAFSSVLWPIQRFSLVLAEMRGVSDVIENFSLKSKVSKRSVEVSEFNELIFDHNDLGYDDETILKDVDLEIRKGEKILIIGPSGAGKSTILKTIRQSITPCEGVVTLNGHNINDIKAQNYFELFSTVDQVGFIFSGKLKDNITLFQDIDDHKVSTVMKQVGLGELDINTSIQNDGDNLSGGQRARVLLARALCLDAQVIICDEIFASLDASVARSIEADLLSLDMTSINVSHIFFEENLPQYTRIYIVENSTIKIAQSLQEVHDRMLEVSHN